VHDVVVRVHLAVLIAVGFLAAPCVAWAERVVAPARVTVGQPVTVTLSGNTPGATVRVRVAPTIHRAATAAAASPTRAARSGPAAALESPSTGSATYLRGAGASGPTSEVRWEASEQADVGVESDRLDFAFDTTRVQGAAAASPAPVAPVAAGPPPPGMGGSIAWSAPL